MKRNFSLKKNVYGRRAGKTSLIEHNNESKVSITSIAVTFPTKRMKNKNFGTNTSFSRLTNYCT